MRITPQPKDSNALGFGIKSIPAWIPAVVALSTIAVAAVLLAIVWWRTLKYRRREARFQDTNMAKYSMSEDQNISDSPTPSEENIMTSPILPAYPIDPGRLEQALPALPQPCKLSRRTKSSLWARCCMFASMRPSTTSCENSPERSRLGQRGTLIDVNHPNYREARIRNIEIRRALIDSGLLLGPPRINRDGTRNMTAWNNPCATAEDILIEEDQLSEQDRRERRRQREERRQRRRDVRHSNHMWSLPTYSEVPFLSFVCMPRASLSDDESDIRIDDHWKPDASLQTSSNLTNDLTKSEPFRFELACYVLCVFCPPIAVLLVRGCVEDLAICVLLSLLGYLPGMLFALYIVSKHLVITFDAHGK
ncbi:hypothetical protein OIV83_003584 [Microbotryomycetes sp. JL201]|nr:hypothetical protein OIV83_003584 [Microbotryomycetes sp. JL201]